MCVYIYVYIYMYVYIYTVCMSFIYHLYKPFTMMPTWMVDICLEDTE